MKINVTGKQIKVGDALRSYVEDRLDSLVLKYYPNPIQGSVAFSREGNQFCVDVSVHPLRGVLLQGRATGNDAHGAFDGACEKISKQLRRYKRRIRDHKGKGMSEAQEIAKLAIIASDEDEEEITTDENGAPTIVAELAADIPTCTVSGAVMRMDLANVNALMFRNAGSGELNMVHRRADGNIGWVDPQKK